MGLEPPTDTNTAGQAGPGSPFAAVRADEIADPPMWAAGQNPRQVEHEADQLLRRLPPAARHAIDTTVTWLRNHVAEAGAAVAAYCVSVEPELRRHTEDFSITTATATANIGQIIWGIENGIEPRDIPAPPEALEFARRYARRQLSLRAVQRTYHLGHAWLWHQWSTELRRLLVESPELGPTLAAVSLFLFTYIDTATAAVADEYVTETVRWQRGVEARLLRAVRAILREDDSPDEAPPEIDWDFDQSHLGLVVWTTLRETEPALHDYARSLGARLHVNVLNVWPDDQSSLWLWLHRLEPIDADELTRLGAPPRTVRLAIGEPATGLSGFRRTHQQAILAKDVARLARDCDRRIWLYREHQLAVLATADRANARRFVNEQLGGLVEQDETTSALRDTLREYLLADMNRVRAATRLHVHRNTLAYRLDRAAELRGAPIDHGRLELEVALSLFDLFLGNFKSVQHPRDET